LLASEALSLSSRCDSILLVVRAGVTTKQALGRVKSMFQHTQAFITGVVMNAIDTNSPQHRPYYRSQVAA